MLKKFIPFALPLTGSAEKKEVCLAIDSGWITLGPRTKQFEEDFAKYINVPHAVALTSCTAAIQLALIVAGVGPGDEVITTSFTFAATSNAIVHVGARPVLVDVLPDSYNIDPSKIEAKITKKTKAIIIVHYGGYPADLTAIMAIAKKHKLEVIEDAAHAVGTKYKGKMIGSHGNLVCFSFHPIKNITTGDGGMITTPNAQYAQRLSQLRLHGMSKDAWKRHSAAGSWRYDILEHGFKYNMTDVAAAMGIHQLRRLEGFIQTRQKYAEYYQKSLSKIPEITVPPMGGKDIRHAWNLYTIKVNTGKLNINRDEIVEELKLRGVGSSVYFISLSHLTAFKKLGYKQGDFPVCDDLSDCIVSLPIYPKMRFADVKYVTKTLESIIEEHRKNDR